MRLLVDTSSFLWFVAGSGRLSEKARKLMEDFDQFIPEKLEENEIEILQFLCVMPFDHFLNAS